jgi:hypothetical protein
MPSTDTAATAMDAREERQGSTRDTDKNHSDDGRLHWAPMPVRQRSRIPNSHGARRRTSFHGLLSPQRTQQDCSLEDVPRSNLPPHTPTKHMAHEDSCECSAQNTGSMHSADAQPRTRLMKLKVWTSAARCTNRSPPRIPDMAVNLKRVGVTTTGRRELKRSRLTSSRVVKHYQESRRCTKP